jgi:C4-dicarboxylate-specific signal transduction histidine kinase
MAAGIAHELNQPLLGVRGLAEHLLIARQRGWDLSEDKIREKLSLVMQQADRMAHIIEHVRVFAREAGKPDCCQVKWNQVVESALHMIGAQLHSRGFDVQSELAEDLPLVSANPFSLEEIVLNLVFNARDAVQKRFDAGHPLRPPDIRLRTCAQGEPPDRRVQFQVIDTGGGIPKDRIDKVFDPFYTTKPTNEGTGLGLSICKSIAAQFDGTMQLESTVGEGTTATVSLPAIVDVQERGESEQYSVISDQ